MFGRSACAAATALALVLGGLALRGQASQAPTFSDDVAPILYRNCVSCHNPGGPGPFSLLTYADAKGHAKEIAAATRSGFMPPFPPQAAPGTFEDEHRLSKAQIDCISDWVNDGAAGRQPGTNATGAGLSEAR